MKITQSQKIVFAGDSITDAGRTRPNGEGLFDPLGKGYVSMVEALLTATYSELKIRVVNQGCSGDNVRQLKDRWQTDVLDRAPEWVAILIGINDVWRQFDTPRQPENHVLPEEYRATLEELLALTLPRVGGVILMAPFYIESLKADAMRARMEEYAEIVRQLAEKHELPFVDLQAAFDQVLKTYHSSALAWDRIHPNQGGHMIIAKAFLKAIDFSW